MHKLMILMATPDALAALVCAVVLARARFMGVS